MPYNQILPDIAGSYFAGHDQGEKRADRNTLRQLMPQAMQGDEAAIGRVAGISPQHAGVAQDANKQKLLKQRGAAKYMMAAIQTGDPQRIQAAHRAVADYLGRETGQQVPPEYDDATMRPNIERLLAMTEHLESGASGIPAEVQTIRQLTAGLSKEDAEKAIRVHLGLDPRASSGLPFAPLEFVGPDGRTYTQAFDKRTGQAAPPNAPAGNRPSALALAGELRQFGATITSGFRDPANNRRVGGVANSQHMSGTAFDAVLPPQIKQQAIEYGRSQGYEVIDEGDHVHFELPSGGNAYASPTPGEMKYGETRGSKAAEFDADRERAGFDQQQAGDVEAAKVAGEQRGKAAASLSGAERKADQAIAVIDKALAHPGRTTATGMSNWLDPRNYVPGTDAKDFRVLAKQIEGKAFLEAFDSLRGGGAITEREGAAATAAMARLDMAQSDEEYEAALRELRDILQSAKGFARSRAGQEAPAAPQAPSGWSVKRVR